MLGGESLSLPLTHLHLACGRIVSSARSIVEAHCFGVLEGPHGHPWTTDYMSEAVKVYAEALPVSYQRDVASLFRRSGETMAEVSIPASDALERQLAAQPESAPSQPATSPEIDDHEPVVVRFDRLAGLTTSAGARQLEQAALAVQGEVDGRAAVPLDEEHMRLLRAVASGAAIADLAVEFGYSRRSMYRELAKLWRALGVSGRVQGVRRAAAEGLLD